MSTLHDNTGRIQGLIEGISALPKDRYEDGLAEGLAAGQGEADALIAGTLTEYTNDRVTGIYQYAFAEKKNLQAVSFPNVEAIGQYAFNGASNLTDLNFPKLKTAEFYGFSGIGAKSVRFPSVTWVNNRGISNSPNLVLVDLPIVASFASSAMINNPMLMHLVIRNTTGVCKLGNANVFSGGPIHSGTGFVYFPAALVDSHKAATNWSALAPAQFRVLEDYTVDGTITGELDLEKMGVTL